MFVFISIYFIIALFLAGGYYTEIRSGKIVDADTDFVPALLSALTYGVSWGAIPFIAMYHLYTLYTQKNHK